MLPLLERHLLGEPRHLLALRPQRRGNQRMAAPAEPRVAHLVALRRQVGSGRGVHHRLVPFIDVEGPILRPIRRSCPAARSSRCRRTSHRSPARSSRSGGTPSTSPHLPPPCLPWETSASGNRENKSVCRPASRSAIRTAGIWQIEHSSSIACFDSG